ncbi:unnamed protein product [Periconia digitata]|uniref:NAD(P)-binding domain-containing protein n=1 Tax=Periconia digitata TaxID=1303443 RepID=A0A9W4UNI5_9PLEO|nr:unnamed protein product [Periconia digitata]
MPQETNMSILVIGSTGKIGRRLIPRLLSSPSTPTLVLPTTKEPSTLLSTVSSLPGYDESRVHVPQGSISDPPFLDALLQKHSVTSVFMAMTGPDELFTTSLVLSALQRSATVKHVVYISAAGDYSVDAIKAGGMQGSDAANVLVKFLVEAKLKYGIAARDDGESADKGKKKTGFSWTVLGPTLFTDNDAMGKQWLMERGVYFQALGGGAGISFVDVEDIALAGVIALEDDGRKWGGKKIIIGGKKAYTGDEVAKLWSDALRKELRLAERDEVEADLAGVIGPGHARMLADMFQEFGERGFAMSEEQYREQVAFLGKEPEEYEQFVQSTAQAWKAE